MIATHRSQLYLKDVGVEHEGDERGEQNHAELGGEGGQHRVPGGHLALVLRVPVQRQEPVHLGPWVYILTSNMIDKVKQMFRYLLLASNNYLRHLKDKKPLPQYEKIYTKFQYVSTVENYLSILQNHLPNIKPS